MTRKLLPSLLAAMAIFISPSVAHSRTAFAINKTANPDEFLQFNILIPDSQTLVGSSDSLFFIQAVDFSAQAAALYAASNIREFGTIDVTTGVFTPMRNITGILPNHNITGLTIDPATNMVYLYSVHGFGGSTPGALYTLNVENGTATVIGQQGEARQVGDIAANAAGQIFAVDLDTDSLFSIDKASGSATLIGPLGFDIIGGGQGLDFDPNDDTLFTVLSNRDQSTSVFAMIDILTGAHTPVSDFAGRSMKFTLGPDSDADSDGVLDGTDVFPLDPTETADADGDGVGDNTDAFPLDPAETADADRDGMGDSFEGRFDLNSNDPGDVNLDNDEDGATNLEEFEMGRNPIVNEGVVITIINAVL